MKACQLSKIEQYNHLYKELYNKSKRLDKPIHLADHYILARIYKYSLYKTGKEEVEEKLEKDYFLYQSMF